MKVKRAVLYARVSRDDTTQDRRNLTGQLEMCREYAVQKGHVVVAELAEDDRGASGAEIDLPQLNHAREMARAREFDVLIAREIDRLSRNLAKQLIVEDELKRYGVTIEYALGEYPDTPEGSLMKHVRASVAEFERLKIIERSTRGRRQKVKAGSVLVAQHPPYGYDVVQLPDKKYALVINETEAEVVRLIFQWYTSPLPTPIRAIARRLSDLRMPMPKGNIRRRKSDRGWGDGAVRKILGNETYLGIWHYGKTRRGKINDKANWITIQVPAIIDRAIWDAAQVQLTRNRELAKRNMKHEYLMYRRIQCGHCNSTLACKAERQGEKIYKYYICSKPGCPKSSCNVALLDSVVWDWVRSLVLNPQELAKGAATFLADKEQEVQPVRAQLNVAENLITDNQAQLTRLLDLYLSQEFEKDILVERKARLEATIKSLEVERASLLKTLEALTQMSTYAQNIETFSAEVQSCLHQGETEFAARSQLITVLNLTGTLQEEDGAKVLYARCVLSSQALAISTTATCDRRRCKNQRQSRSG